MPDRWVAFLRNVNQGQRGHVSTGKIVSAFATAGARDAVPFRSNGTVVFEAGDGPSVGGAAAASLGLDGVVRELRWVAGIVDRFGGSPRCELTVFDGPDPAGHPELFAHALRGRCRMVSSGAGWAVIENDVDRRSSGTPVVEATLGVPATSRGMPTLVALADRFAVG